MLEHIIREQDKKTLSLSKEKKFIVNLEHSITYKFIGHKCLNKSELRRDLFPIIKQYCAHDYALIGSSMKHVETAIDNIRKSAIKIVEGMRYFSMYFVDGEFKVKFLNRLNAFYADLEYFIDEKFFRRVKEVMAGRKRAEWIFCKLHPTEIFKLECKKFVSEAIEYHIKPIAIEARDMNYIKLGYLDIITHKENIDQIIARKSNK